MFQNQKNIENDNATIERYNPEVTFGLSEEQVSARVSHKLVNKTKKVVGKTYFEIISTNIFSFFNVLLYIIAGLMIFGEQPITSFFFLIVLFCNVIIGLYQDIKARILMDKLSVITAPRATVIRNGQKKDISISEIVLDDLMFLKASSQISADAIVVKGNISVNESLLTGEPNNIIKKPGDILYSGSYVTSGEGVARADKIGKDSYVETVQGQARKFKRSASQILKSVNRMFVVIGVCVISIALWYLILLAAKGGLSSPETFKKEIGNIAGSLVSMIPAGLYLLTSVALAVGVINLAQKKAQVQDFYSIEMLSRTNVLCVDKTGTITDGTMNVKEIIPLNKFSLTQIENAVCNIIYSTKDDNFTAVALKNHFNNKIHDEIITSLPFNSENKYSGVTLKTGNSYVVGAAEFLDLIDKAAILKKATEYSEKGYRVLIVATNKEAIKNNKIQGKLTGMGMIIIQDHIKEDAPDTFKWFNENKVEVKVISGDNAVTVSEVAHQAGIKNYDKYISLEGMSKDEVTAIADKYTIFGRVSPEQKEVLVLALKEAGKTVAMTGDGVNDILALKRADCSIAMASGSEAARNVSHIVLLDSNFSRLPDIVGEGRRVVNNLQRTCSVFLVKTIFATLISLLVLILSSCGHSSKYPFVTNNMYLWEIITIGVAAFFLALQKNNEPIKGQFLSNIFKKAVPAGVMILLAVGVIYFGAFLQANGLVYTGISSYGLSSGVGESAKSATAMAIIAFSLLSLVVLYGVCRPLDKYRALVFAGSSAIVVGGLLVSGLAKPSNNLFKIDFTSLTGANYLYLAVVVIILSTLYILWLRYFDYRSKKEKKL